jgi:hypothetical protein
MPLDLRTEISHKGNMKYVRSIFLQFLLIFSAVTCVKAEVTECNGIWSNKPCEQVPAKTNKSNYIAVDPATAVPPLNEQKENNKSQVELQKCKEGENFMSDRPLPLVKANERTLKTRSINRDIEIYGSVYGHGKVSLEVSAKGQYGSVERAETKGAKTITLTDKGEEKEFSIKITLANNWEWTAEVKNLGTFEGYCTTPAEETAKASIKQKFLEPKKTEVRQNNTFINNTLIIDRGYP